MMMTLMMMMMMLTMANTGAEDEFDGDDEYCSTVKEEGEGRRTLGNELSNTCSHHRCRKDPVWAQFSACSRSRNH